MRYILTILILSWVLSGCEEEGGNLQPGKDSGFKYIDTTELIGSSSLQFPLVTNPEFISVAATEFLNKGDNVYIYNHNNNIYIYPVKSLYIEIVNQSFKNKLISMTYCPVTGSGLAVDRIIDGDTLLFRASGLRYKENLMPYDNINESIWSQMLMKCVKGKYSGKTYEVLPIVETNWSTAKEVYPNANVLSQEPEESKKEYHFISHKSTKSPGPENGNGDNTPISDNSKVFGTLEGSGPLIAEYNDFPDDSIAVIKHAGSSTVFVGSQKPRFIMAFKINTSAKFQGVQNSLPTVMKDSDGNYYDWFGNVVKGSRQGSTLEVPNYYTAYWWSWKDFFSSFSHIQ